MKIWKKICALRFLSIFGTCKVELWELKEYIFCKVKTWIIIGLLGLALPLKLKINLLVSFRNNLGINSNQNDHFFWK